MVDSMDRRRIGALGTNRKIRRRDHREIAESESRDTLPRSGHNLRGACLRLENRAIEQLRPATRPLRRVTRKHQASIASSIRQHGFCAPIMIKDDGEVIDGHARIAAAKSVGFEQVPCIVIDHLTDLQVRTLRLALNRLQEKGQWDLDALKLEFEEMLDLEIPLEVTGFEVAEVDLLVLDHGDEAEPDSLDPEANRIPDRETTPISREGDLWVLGRHKILCANALDQTAYAALMDQEAAVGVFTDPPYNVPIQGHVCGKGSIHHPEFIMASGEMTPEAFQAFLQDFLCSTADVVADGGILYVCIDWRHVRELLESAEYADLSFMNLCVWVKNNAGMGSFYRSQHELVVVSKKGKASHINNIQLGKYGRNRSNIWRYPGVNGLDPERRKELKLHPTVKPCEMVADAILDSTTPGDIVLDPFLGSGTTAIACEKTGRVCRGMDLDPRYVDVAVRRWQDFVGSQAVHAKTGLTFDQMAKIRWAPVPLLPPPAKTEITEEA